MTETSATLKVSSDLKNLSSIRNFVVEAAERIGLSEDAISELRLAVDEACANIIQHGYKDTSGDIDVTVKGVGDKMIVALSDTAPQHNPLEDAAPPDLEAPLELRSLGGMGVLIIKQNTDAVEYKSNEQGGNTLILTKLAQAPAA